MKSLKYPGIIITIIILAAVVSGCGFQKHNRGQSQQKTIKIAEQYGLAYAPVQIMKKKQFLQEEGNIKVAWKQLSNTAAIREAMLAEEVDIGFMAIPPFLIARDKGMKWRIISGLSMSPLGLMTYKQDIKGLEDISESDKIVLPQPGSIQHILLSMAAERKFGHPEKFDNQLVTMNHPDGMNALLSKKDITAHFTSPPYMFMESKDKDVHKILSGKQAMGQEFTFIIGVGTDKFHNNNPDLYQAFSKALEKSINYINKNPKKAAGLLSESYDLKSETLREYMEWEGMKYTRQIKGLEKFIEFMKKNDYISAREYDISKLIWEEQYYEK